MPCCVNVLKLKIKLEERFILGICSDKLEVAQGNRLIATSFVLPEQIVWKKQMQKCFDRIIIFVL